MDFAKFRQAIEDVRRHLDAGDKEVAITGFSEAMGVDRAAATAAVDQIAAGEMVTVTESSLTGPGGAGGDIDKIMAAVAGGGLTARLFKLGGLDLTKIMDALEAGGDGKSVVTSQTTVSVSGGGLFTTVAVPLTSVTLLSLVDRSSCACASSVPLSIASVTATAARRGRLMRSPPILDGSAQHRWRCME